MSKQMVTYQELFGYLEKRLAGGEQCDNTLRLTKEFAEKHDLSFGELSQILEGMGGFCDCQVLLNSAATIPAQDCIGQESFKTPWHVAVELGFYCHLSHEEGVDASRAGQWVPCSKDDPDAMPDLNRAIKHIRATVRRNP